MQISRSSSFFALAVIFTGIAVCSVAAPALGGGAARKANASRPAPDVGRRVYTNDDLGWPGARPAPAQAVQPSPAGQGVAQAAAKGAAEAAASMQLSSEQDPRWYAQQSASLEEELAGLSGRAAALRRFRASSAGQPTGLVLDAPCEGITTDNLIAQLDLRRREILRQLDDLDDTARRNGVAPGAVAEARAAAQIQRPLSADKQRAALAETYRQRSDELAQTRAVLTGMRESAAARGITLLTAAPGTGGNMTTDLVQRLDARASTLASQLRGVEDDARRAGAQAGLLR